MSFYCYQTDPWSCLWGVFLILTHVEQAISLWLVPSLVRRVWAV